MRFIMSVLCTAVIFAPSGCQAQNDPAARMQVDSVRIQRIGREEITADVQVTFTAPKGLRLQRVLLKNVRANGIPVFADPLQISVATTGSPAALPPMHLHLYPADVSKAADLERALREHTVRLTATAFVEVQASLLQRLLLGQSHPVAVWAVQREVPFRVPGSLSSVGLGVLGMGLRLAAPLAGKLLSAPEEANGTATVRTCWNTANAGHRCTEHLAFASGGRLLTAAEAIEPWRFDPLLSQELPIKGSSANTVLIAGGVETPVSATLSVRPQLRRALVLPGKHWVSYAEPESPLLYADLHRKAPATPALVRTLPMAPCAAGTWQPAHVYRVAQQEGRNPESVGLQVRRLGGELRLSRPLDDGASGSPIVTGDGVVGLVQSGGSAVLLVPEECRTN